MKKKILLLLLLVFFPILKVNALGLKYQSHVQQKGWMDWVSQDELSGTTCLSLRMEAIKIELSDQNISGDINYQVHVQTKGWMDWVKNGEMAGTTGQGLRMEAIKINLSGDLKNNYDVYYRAYVQQKGWMDWVKNGEIAGTTGQRLRVEAVQIKLVNNNPLGLSYSVYNSDGWNNYVGNGEIAGTTGQAKRIEKIKIKTNNTNLSGNVEYSVANINGEWTNVSKNDEENGYNDSKIEAVKIKLTDELAENYDIYYRVHVANFGWLDWTKNEEPAGTRGWYKQIEAIQIRVVNKGDNTIKTGSNSYKVCKIDMDYQAYVQQKAWMGTTKVGEVAGTTGQGLRMEAIKINLKSDFGGTVKYSTYVEGRGWQGWKNSGELSGTTGLSKKMEVIAIKLDGEVSKYYDIYYRVHSSQLGWQGWAKNGSNAGSMNSNTRIEAIQIKIVDKNASFDVGSVKPYVTGKWNSNKYYDYFGNMATGFKFIDGLKYYFNREGKLYGSNVQKVIDVSSWQGTIDWETIKKNEDIDAAIIRVGWGTSYNDPCGLDSYYDRNVREVQRLGIPYGVYIYAYAETTAAAQKEADYVVSKMKQYNMPSSTWVWYDAEIKSISRNTYNTVIPAFVNRVKSQGYNNVGVYSGVSQLDTTNGNTNTPTIRSYPIWVSQYYKDLQYTGTYKGWQFASDEHIAGISGDVDCSMFFK